MLLNRRKFAKVLLLLPMLFFSFSAFAQKNVSGTVTAATDGLPLPGVNVLVQGTTQGTITDLDGKYQLSVKEGQTLSFTFIGFTTQNVVVGASNIINVTLQDDSKELDDVVVVGYGTVKKSDVTGSVVSVDREAMMKKAPTNIGQALQGAAAGVIVTAQDGAPDANTAVRIRGIATVNGTADPLYVVDGVQVGTNANFINPSDIESMEVLKDASATAIYGSAGANGVIMITTKHGKKGHVAINVTGDWGIQTLPYHIETLSIDEMAKTIREARKNDGMDRPYNRIWDEEYDGKRNEIDWQDQMTRHALKQQYGISASGGTDNGSYNFSVGYLDHEGLIVNTGYRRLTGRANGKAKALNGHFEFGGDMNFVHTESHGSNQGLANNGNLSSHRDLAFMTPTLDYVDEQGNYIKVNVKNPNGTYGAMNRIDMPGQGWEGNTRIFQNPYATQMEASGKNANNRTSLSAFGDIEFFKGLNLHSIATFTHSSGEGSNFTGGKTRTNYIDGKEETFDANGDQLYNFSVNNNSSQTIGIETYLTYKFENDFNNFSLMVGNSVSKYKGQWVNASAKDFLAETMRDTNLSLDDSSKKGSGAYNTDNRMISYYGRLMYNLLERYILTATVRRDGSSNFSEGNKWGVFPSVAFAWRAKEESFLKDVDAISNLKVRLGWGETGNAGNMSGKSVASLASTSYYFYPNGTPMGLNSNHSNKQPGLYGPLVDKDLKWETNTQTNAGIDFGFLGNDLTISVDYFIRKTTDLLINRQMRSSSGFTEIYTNYGEIKNSGLEFSINYNTRLNDDWTIGVTFNGSTLKNEVTKMDRPIYAQATGGNDGSTLDGSNVQAVDGGSSWDNHSISKQGEAVGSFYGWRVDKIYTSQAEIDADNAAAKTATNGSVEYRQQKETSVGDFRFKDLNNDGIVDDKDREVLGNGLPKFNYGLNLTASYKNWDFSMYSYGVAGQKLLSYSAMRLSTVYISDDNTAANILKDSYDDIKAGKLPRLSCEKGNINHRVSDAWVKNGNFFRISNLQVGYTLPKDISKALYISNARIYASVQNLALISKYKKYGDPECGQGSVLYSGLDTGRYPNPRTFMFGVNVTF